ncbi:hypothetical protein X961_2975 [Burkholderia pseudomallei MSHR5613]|nr:hypothetical protein X961_2975 [Burkholderia pseudomallei MSHR5613]
MVGAASSIVIFGQGAVRIVYGCRRLPRARCRGVRAKLFAGPHHLTDEGLYLYKNTVFTFTAVVHGCGKPRVAAR